MKNKRILSDVDGCLLDWLSRFTDYMQREGFEAHLDEPNQYDLGAFFNISTEEVHERIGMFNNGHWTFGTLQAYDGAQEAIKILSDLDYTFVAVTSCSDKPQVADLRRANLFNIFGDVFEEVHCIGIHQDKSPILESYEPTFWIEDKFPHAVSGAEAGHKAIILDQPWNKGEKHNKVKRCHSWAEIVQYILK